MLTFPNPGPLPALPGLACRQMTPDDAVEIIRLQDAMLQALEYVVSNAIPKAQIPGYRVGGKSGTAKVAVAGGYGKDYMAWFAGFAPASNPRFVMVVVINEPKGDAYYGGAVATPPFAEAMGGVLQLFNIRPDAIPPEVPAKLARTEANNGAPRT